MDKEKRDKVLRPRDKAGAEPSGRVNQKAEAEPSGRVNQAPAPKRRKEAGEVQ